MIVAANVPLSRLLFQTKIAHYRSYAIAARVAEPRLEGLFWDTDDPYHYLRSVGPVEGAGSLLVVGGEDHKTGGTEETTEHYERLLSYMKERFHLREVGFRWSGQIIEPVDGLPLIGPNGPSSQVFVATGYGGNGITFGTAAAMILSDRLLGRENPWSRLFDAGRIKPLAAARDFLAENIDVPLHMLGDRLRPPDVARLGDIARGEGKTVRVKGERLAVFRDEQGALHACSPVCPHLGCHVHFNDAEKTWDCPCHGSRFDTGGEVLNGPAMRGLTRRPVSDEDDR